MVSCAVSMLAMWCSLVACVDEWAQERARVELSVRRGQGTMFFTHVHKGGGTTMCAIARATGMTTQKNVPKSGSWAGHNCNPTFEDAFASSKGLPEEAIRYASRMRGSTGRSLFYALEGRLPSALAFGTSPAGHVEHSAVPGVSAKVPAGQSRQSASVVCSAALVPASLRYVPAGHCAQLAWPVVLVYSPAAWVAMWYEER